MARFELVLLILSTIMSLHISEATLCKPYSTFKMDCNNCNCSSSGTEFSCTKEICWPLIYKDKYLIEENERGYKILKPKPTGHDVDDGKRLKTNNDVFADDSITANGKVSRGQRNIPIPYQRENHLRNPSHRGHHQILLPKEYKLNNNKDLFLDDDVSNDANIRRGQRYILPHQSRLSKLQKYVNRKTNNDIQFDQEDQNQSVEDQNKSDEDRSDQRISDKERSDELDGDEFSGDDEDDDDDDEDKDNDDSISSWGRITAHFPHKNNILF